MKYRVFLLAMPKNWTRAAKMWINISCAITKMKMLMELQLTCLENPENHQKWAACLVMKVQNWESNQKLKKNTVKQFTYSYFFLDRVRRCQHWVVRANTNHILLFLFLQGLLVELVCWSTIKYVIFECFDWSASLLFVEVDIEEEYFDDAGGCFSFSFQFLFDQIHDQGHVFKSNTKNICHT